MDDRLVGARLRAGDDTALAEVFDLLGPLVHGLARRLTANQSMAEDVTQEVFAELWRRPERFDPERGSLRAYLGVMAHRRAVDAVRRSERAQRREDRAGRLEAAPSGAGRDHADAAALAESVRSAVAHLPAEQRRAVDLAFGEGMTHREIAELLEIPEGTVKSRLRLAQAKLRDLLSELAIGAG